MKSLATKMAAILGEVPTMIKNGRNQQQNYDFVSVEDIKAVLRPLLHRHRIALFSNVLSVERTSHIVTKTYGKDVKESTVITVLANMKFVLVDGDTGETMEHFWVGEATDYGDKALNKAATAGLKYWLNSTFLLSTTEPDADEEYIPAPAQYVAVEPAPQITAPVAPQEPLATPSMVDKVESLAAAYYRSEWSEEFKKGLVYKTTKKRTADITLLTQAEAQRMIDYFTNAIETEPQPA